LKEFHRVLKLGGRAHAIEGDWDLMVVEPIPKVAWQSLVERASVACRTPDIGRKLTGLLAKCGFREIRVTVHTRPDLTGRLLPMIRNMTKYAQINSALSASEIVPELEKAIEENTYLAVAPQFVATGVK